jgi:hypothetical protein
MRAERVGHDLLRLVSVDAARHRPRGEPVDRGVKIELVREPIGYRNGATAAEGCHHVGLRLGGGRGHPI